MKIYLRVLGPILFVIAAAAPRLNAQIANDIRAHVDHSFVIGNTTLPPGDYTFHLSQSSGLSSMTATSANDKTTVEFLVRDAISEHRPAHSELVFRKYGNTEFLSKIFEGGSANGSEVIDSSLQESRFVEHHQHPVEHSEVQK